MYSLKRFWSLSKGSRFLYLSAIISTAIATLLSLVSPLIIKFIVDSAINKAPVTLSPIVSDAVEKIGGIEFVSQNLWICGLLVIAISILEGIFSFFRGTLSASSSEIFAKKLKDNLYDHLQNLPYDYHVKAQTGDLIQRCTSDVETIRKFLSIQLVELARSIFLIFFSISIMINLSFKLTLVSLIIVPIIVPFSYFFVSRITKEFLLADEKEGELSTVLQENLSGIRVVRAFGRQKFEIEKFEKKNKEFKILILKMIYRMSAYWTASNFLSRMQVLAVLVAGAIMTHNGEIPLGTMIVFASYINMLVDPIGRLGRILGDMGKMTISLERVYEILQTPLEKDTDGATVHDLKGDIIFENVSFKYGDGKTVLNSLSFTVKAGETVAILGSTGSGKSSIMHLLLRLYDYKSGSIKINGKELQYIQKNHLRKKIGIVLQEPFLFSKTIKENLKMAGEKVSEDEIITSTKTACIHSVIENFEKKYDTVVGEKGVTLSGGQKQRVAIARTLIKNSDILIFDDSLSAVDTETDSKIRKALNERSNNVTTFIISQRITTLMEADKIFIIENGELSDVGTHDQLISRKGLYSRIWKIQNMLEEDFESEVTA